MRPHRRGISLVELTVTMTLMGILLSYTAPRFHRAVEQSQADLAAGNLRALWSAQRLYRLDHPAYASSLDDLVAAGLLDANFPSPAGSTSAYAYAVDSADAGDFAITATRSGGAWAGGLSIDATGAIAGAISRPGEADITPGFL